MSGSFTRAAALTAFDEALAAEGESIYVPPHTDARLTESDIREHMCEPFEVSATAVAPGFSFADVGETLSGFCIAHDAGYWLVYQPTEKRFLCFWGTSPARLSAHGVVGNPLYCWSA